MSQNTHTIPSYAERNVKVAKLIKDEVDALRKQMTASHAKIHRMLNSMTCDDDVCAENPVYDSGFELREAVTQLTYALHNARNDISSWEIEQMAQRVASKYDFDIDAYFDPDYLKEPTKFPEFQA